MIVISKKQAKELGAEQVLKLGVLDKFFQYDQSLTEPKYQDMVRINADTPVEVIEEIIDLYEGEILDYWYEMDQFFVPSNIPAPWSIHYESKSVAVLCCNSVWVGFTEWSGGGKHGAPESMDKNEHFLEVVNTERITITKYTFVEG
jgi:hypothetical protein